MNLSANNDIENINTNLNYHKSKIKSDEINLNKSFTNDDDLTDNDDDDDVVHHLSPIEKRLNRMNKEKELRKQEEYLLHGTIHLSQPSVLFNSPESSQQQNTLKTIKQLEKSPSTQAFTEKIQQNFFNKQQNSISNNITTNDHINNSNENELLKLLNEVEQNLNSSSSSSSLSSTQQIKPSLTQIATNHIRYKVIRILKANDISFNGAVPNNEIHLCVIYQPINLIKHSSKIIDQKFWVILKDTWRYTPVRLGDIINIIATFEYKYDNYITYITDHNTNLLILLPDLLISATRVSNSVKCVRSAMLPTWLRIFTTSKAALKGNVAHTLFQSALRKGSCDRDFLLKIINNIIQEEAISLHTMKISDNEIYSYLTELIPIIQRFFDELWGNYDQTNENFIHITSQQKKFISWSYNNGNKSTFLKLKRILEIEDNIYSINYGLKGKVDVTVEAETSLVNDNNDEINTKQQHIMPFEIKTGSYESIEHRAQVLLYTLMMSERYNANVISGLLFYLKKNNNYNDDRRTSTYYRSTGKAVTNLKGMNVISNEIAALIQKRNELARYEYDNLKNHVSKHIMPPLLMNKRICNKCFFKNECAMYHKLFENGTSTTSGMYEDDFNLLTSGIETDLQLQYAQQMYRNIALEYIEHKSNNDKQFWLHTSEQGAIDKRTCGNLKVHQVEKTDQHRFLITFIKQQDIDYNFIQSFININDFFVISTDHGINSKISVATGIIDAITSNSIILRIAPVPGDEYIEINQSADQITDIEDITSLAKDNNDIDHITIKHNKSSSSLRLSLLSGSNKDIIWRLDKNVYDSSFSTPKMNLYDLFTPNIIEDENNKTLTHLQIIYKKKRVISSKYRKLLCDLISPKFSSMDMFNLIDSTPFDTFIEKLEHKDILYALEEEYLALNDNQQQAINHVLLAHDYALILGMPGTGKSTIVVFLLRLLAATGNKVLLSAHTHTAVDNIFLKLKDKNQNSNLKVQMLRIGNAGHIHANLHDVMFSSTTMMNTNHILPTQEDAAKILSATQGSSSIKVLFDSINIFGVTALGIRDKVLQNTLFDYCIIDEASQITQPICLGPILLSNKFILVGDHYQLEPLVQSTEAFNNGMGISLFRRLSDQYPNSVIELYKQYRMNNQILQLCNTYIYQFKMKCATEQIATKRLLFDDKPDKANNTSLFSIIQTDQYQLWLQQNQMLFNDQFITTTGLFINKIDYKQQLEAINHLSYLKLILNSNKSVNYLDTSQIQLCTNDNVNNYRNDGEIWLVITIVKQLLALKINSHEIGIISPYRKHLKLIQIAIQTMAVLLHNNDWLNIEVDTVDRYQGRDKSCIIMTWAANDYETSKNDSILLDWRRINVAISRAKLKLIFIGSYHVLSQVQLLKQILSYCQDNQWSIQLKDTFKSDYKRRKKI